MSTASLLSYSVDPINDCVSGVLLFATGERTTHVFRESHYLPHPNWSEEDLMAAFTASIEDHATITLAARATEINAALGLVKQHAADAVTALTAPPEDATPTIQHVEASMTAHVEAANRLIAVRDNLVRAAQEAEKVRLDADAEAARAKAKVAADAEVERAKVARAAEDARIMALVKEQLTQMATQMAGSAPST